MTTQPTTTAETKPREFTGTIVSNKMTKTVVVRVDRVLVHPRYGKRYRSSEKYQVHAPTGTFTVGQQVRFVECRPISRHKRWRIIPDAK
ncbi:MAG: 30S ribosomal protein S17 [Patescibacteria group bacterium]